MGVHQFGELGEDFHNLVGTLTAGCDDYDVGLGLLRDGVLKHGLTRSKGTRDEARTTLYDGVEGVDGAHTRFQQLEGTGFLLVVGHCELHRPVLYHIHLHFVALLVLEHSDGVVNLVLTGRHDALDHSHTLQLEGNHDLQRLMVFFHLTQPVALLYLVADLCQGFEIPDAVVVKWFGVLSSLQEHAFHLVKVVLQTVVVLTQHTGTKLNLEHVTGKLGLCTHLQSASTLKHLHVHVLADDLNHLGHQTVTASCNVAYLSLYHWSVHLKGDHVGDYATNFSFCHFI